MMELFIDAPMCNQRECLFFDTGYCLADLHNITPNTVNCACMLVKYGDNKMWRK
jgi:hypothetical protein